MRHNVEFCTVAWSAPHCKRNKELLEKVHHRFTRMICSVRHMVDNERIIALGFYILDERRNRVDLIFIFKMHNVFSHPPCESLFQLSGHNRTRGSAVKLVTYCTNRLFFFSERVININKFNQLDAEADSVIQFKKRPHQSSYTRMDLLMDLILGARCRIRDHLPVRPYHVLNQVNGKVNVGKPCLSEFGQAQGV